MRRVLNIVEFVDAPPRGTVRVSDREYADPARRIRYVLWRGRWVPMAEDRVDELFALDLDPEARIDWRPA